MEWKVAPSFQSGTITKIDEENHKALVVNTCPRCGGSGMYIIPRIFQGVCFTCNGAGKISKWVKAYTNQEYDKYIANQEKVKERKKAKRQAEFEARERDSETNKKELLAKWGFEPENPGVHIVVGGNTYEIKDELKGAGARYNAAFGWYFTAPHELPQGFSFLFIPVDDVYDWYPQVKQLQLKDNAKDIVNKAKAELLPPSKSEFIGEVKERMRDIRVTLTGARAVSSRYGTSIMFTFEQEENQLVWFTSCPPDEEDAVVGHQYLLTGTVKDHKIYQGIKQTYLNRVVLKDIDN